MSACMCMFLIGSQITGPIGTQLRKRFHLDPGSVFVKAITWANSVGMRMEALRGMRRLSPETATAYSRPHLLV